MADKPISGATTITDLAGTEKLPVAKNGSTGDYNTTTQDILNIGTINGATGGAPGGDGISLFFRAGDGNAASNGGAFYARSGDGGAGAYGFGGNFRLEAGNAPSSTPGYGGQFYLTAGSSLGTPPGGAVVLTTGNAQSGQGGVLGIVLGSGTSKGQVRVADDPSLGSVAKSWFATEPLNGRTIYTATRAELVTAIIGRVDAANGGAATLVVVKCASGTAPGGGTLLSSDSMDLAGTPATNQTLTLSVTASDLLLAAGDSLCLVESGVLGTSVGCITVHTTPQ